MAYSIPILSNQFISGQATPIPTVVKFNVGGCKYEVSQSLLNKHPNTFLAKASAKQLQIDPSAEVFVDRDGSNFKYCLDYMRNGSISLPITVSKPSILADLKFYNFGNFDNNVFECLPTANTNPTLAVNFVYELLSKMDNNIIDIENQMNALEKQKTCFKFAKACFHYYILKNKLPEKTSDLNSVLDPEDLDCLNETIYSGLDESSHSYCDKGLAIFGLKLVVKTSQEAVLAEKLDCEPSNKRRATAAIDESGLLFDALNQSVKYDLEFL